jgi:hypothetical protein
MNPMATTPRIADEAELERTAYNSAFDELGLPWHWDASTHQRLRQSPHERDRVRQYLQTQQAHLLKAYDADFLIDAIQIAKARCCQAMTAPRLGAGTRAP